MAASDATTDNVLSRPVSPADFLGSIYELCGIDPAQSFPDNPINMKAPILPASDPKTRLLELYL